jgi:hypothetical protein
MLFSNRISFPAITSLNYSMTLKSFSNTNVHLLNFSPLSITLVALFVVDNLTTENNSEASVNTKLSSAEIYKPFNKKLLFFST